MQSKFARWAWLVPPAVVLGLYAKTASFPLVWDDVVLLTLPVYQRCDLTKILRSPANGLEYLPVRDLTICFDHAVFGQWGGGFHVTNVLLFAVAAMLVVPIYRALFETAPTPSLRASAPLLALLSALVFIAHPLEVEPVAFVTCRNALLALVFVLGALASYGRFLRSGSRPAYWASVLLVGLAGLSKATAVPVPMLLLLAHLHLKREHGLAAALRSVSPHLVVVAAIAGVHLIIAQQGAFRGKTSVADVLARLTDAPFIARFYAFKFVWPVGLSTEYVLDGPHRSLIVLLSLLVLAAAVPIVVIGLRSRSLACLLVVGYFAALLPVLDLLPTLPPVADRYAQIPMLLLAPLAVYGLARWLPRAAVVGVAAPAIAVLALLSYRQIDVWRSEEALFSHAAEVDPHALKSLDRLAYSRLKDGRTAEAIDAFRRIALVDGREERHLAYGALLALENGDPEAADALANQVQGKMTLNHLTLLVLGDYWLKRGQRARALEVYERARVDARRMPYREPRTQQVLDLLDRKIRALRARDTSSLEILRKLQSNFEDAGKAGERRD